MLTIYVAKIGDIQKSCQHQTEKIHKDRMRKIQQRNIKQQNESFAGTMLLDFAMQREFPDIKHPLRWAYAEREKPYLPDNPHVQFSIAHAGDWVVCAVSTEAIGLDIEREREIRSALIHRFFHPKEQQYLDALENNKRNSAFCDIWVLKEAIAKAKNQPLLEVLREVQCDLACCPIRVTAEGEQVLGTAELVSFPDERYHLGYYTAKTEESYRIERIFDWK